MTENSEATRSKATLLHNSLDRMGYAVTFRPVSKEKIDQISEDTEYLVREFATWLSKWDLDLRDSAIELKPFKHIHAFITSHSQLRYIKVKLEGYHIFIKRIHSLTEWLSYIHKQDAELYQSVYSFIDNLK